MPTNTSGRGGDRRSGREFGPNELKHVLNCLYCHEWFRSARPDTYYCTDAHKSAAARERRKIASAIARQRAAEKRAAKAKAKKKRTTRTRHG